MANQKVISLPFSINENYGISFTTDDKKIYKDRVFLAVMTRLQEKVMQPNYGTQVKDALFETEQVAANIIRGSVSSAFANWLPSLVLLDLNVELEESTSQLIVTIGYRLPNETTDEITIYAGTFDITGQLIEGNR